MGGGEKGGGSKTQWREGRKRGSDMGREETGAAIYFPLRPTDTAHESGEPSAFFPPFSPPTCCRNGVEAREEEGGRGGGSRQTG